MQQACPSVFPDSAVSQSGWLSRREQDLLGHVQPFPRKPIRPSTAGPSTGLARALSKLGICSRRQAWLLVEEGRVRVNGRLQQDPEYRVVLTRDRLEVDGQRAQARPHVYL